MRKMLKKYVAFLCTFSCVLGCMAVNVSAANLENLEYDDETLELIEEEYDSLVSEGYDLTSSGIMDVEDLVEYYAENIPEQYVGTKFVSVERETLKESLTGDEEDDKDINSYLNETEDVGEYKEIVVESFDKEETSMTITGKIVFSEKNVNYTVGVNTEDGTITYSFEKEKTFGEKMIDAALNTVLGMGTVFVVLIFLTLLIGCFKYFSGGDNKKKEETVALAPVVSTPAVVEEDVTDDLELVAVISAAIATYEGTGADGFKVRSIKRVRRSNW